MFSKHRNLIAWLLLLAAAVCWSLGKNMVRNLNEESPVETTAVVFTETYVTGLLRPTVESTTVVEQFSEPYAPGTVTEEASTQILYDPSPEEERKDNRILGYILCLLAAGLVIGAVFFLWQKAPVLGPDGIGLILALNGVMAVVFNRIHLNIWELEGGFRFSVVQIIGILLLFVSVRELFGWLRGRCSFSWCLVQRLVFRGKSPQNVLLLFVAWILMGMAGTVWGVTSAYHGETALIIMGFGVASLFAFLCLWRYGGDLKHFQQQLDHYRQSLPITVGKGSFSSAEQQLLQIQEQHKQAVRAAVTSERFKVELISNVSHDLRTPLTSILGYSELLQREALSPQGQEQLRRLHRKAGYMNELVESLFELTKVSSGVVESKKEDIDLIRLLEQTLGLFDDQLAEAGLIVRRSYCGESLPLVTDGARIHQVFANLLGNAIKYALKDTRIYIEVTEQKNSYLIRMTNTASYEMDFKAEEILQRFARGDKARSTKGSGLGLAIAQTYTESVGGSFRVSVDGDQFNAFVELPIIERNL